MPLTVTILTPGRCLIDDQECHQVELPGAAGMFGVLPDHTPLVTPLAVGELRLLGPDGVVTRRFAIAEGFTEVTPAKVTVTARAAEAAEEIDVDRAKAARGRAQGRLSRRTREIDVARAEAALARATNRLRIASAN